jgi:peptidoglycan-associated lipoprotein
MKKIFAFAMMGLFLTACPSKDKKPEGGEPTAVSGAQGGAGAGGVDSSSITHDPCGSDCGALAGLSTINFGYDKATLDAKGKEVLTKNAEWIKANPKTPIQIEGHCDERGSVEYNFALGERRARVTKDFLVGLGVEGDRLKIISYGKEKPLDKGDSDTSYAKNRRANFVPLPQ